MQVGKRGVGLQAITGGEREKSAAVNPCRTACKRAGRHGGRDENCRLVPDGMHPCRTADRERRKAAESCRMAGSRAGRHTPVPDDKERCGGIVKIRAKTTSF